MSRGRHAWRRAGALLLVAASSLAGCEILVPVGRDDPDGPDASTSDAAAAIVCDGAGASTVTGGGPDRSLGGYHGFARVRGGFCGASLELVLTPLTSLTSPYPSSAVVISAPMPVDLLTTTSDWAGTLAAMLTPADGGGAVGGTIEVAQATTAAGLATTRLQATATFDDADWQLTASVDLPYCTVDDCP